MLGVVHGVVGDGEVVVGGVLVLPGVIVGVIELLIVVVATVTCELTLSTVQISVD